jgi:tRNA(Ile)-lysidine synthase
MTSAAGLALARAGGFSAFDFSSRSAVVAAVSGGGDSIALLLHLQAHLERCAPATRILAVTVDHGLRAQSAAEAEQVGAVCAARGIAHSILRWEGGKPASGVSAAAREARYRLLTEAAKQAGSDLVLTGHTLDDQAETVLMRRQRGEGVGLAGIAPATLFDGTIWIGRPLLGRTREALRDVLRAQNVVWIDDPSNEDTAYERVRARREIAGSADPAAMRQALLAHATEAAARRLALGDEAAELITSAAAQVSPGLFRVDSSRLRSAPRPAAVHALRLLLPTIGGSEHLVDEARASELLPKILAGPCRATLSGAVVDARKGGIFLHREFRGDGPAPIPATDGAVWDGRFRIHAEGGRPGHFVAPLGRQGAAKAVLPDDSIPPGLVRAALFTQPAEADGIRLTPVVSPHARFLPSFDLAPAQALAKLLGAPPFPRPPFTGHNPP